MFIGVRSAIAVIIFSDGQVRSANKFAITGFIEKNFINGLKSAEHI